MEKNISTVIFDFGNVLIDLDIPLFERNIRKLTGLQTQEEESVFLEFMVDYEQGFVSTELFINRVIKFSRLPVQARDVIICWNSMLVGIKPETLLFLKKIKANYHTYILSNTNPLHIEWVHRHLKKDHAVDDFENDYLHGVFYSYNLNLIKPDPDIYRMVQTKIDVSPEEILFVDDREENVLGAQKVGWTATVHPPGTLVSDTLKSFISISD